MIRVGRRTYKSGESFDPKFPGFIENGTLLASKENLQLLLNDAKHPFGHGYCLAWALLDL